MGSRAASLIVICLAAACAEPERRLSYEERMPDPECRNVAFDVRLARGCVGCYAPNVDPDRVLDEAYRKCMAEKPK